jgi:hypothetical protein
VINDAGATISSGSGSPTIQGVSVDNHGTVSVTGGALVIYGGNSSGGSDSGTYTVSSAATIAFQSGSRTIASTAQFSGPGTLQVDGATLTDAGKFSGPKLRLTSGALEIADRATGNVSSLSIASAATVQVDVSNLTPTSEPARAVVSGAAALGGTLVVQPPAGFTPPVGTVLHLMDYASKTGQFATITAPAAYTVNVGPMAPPASTRAPAQQHGHMTRTPVVLLAPCRPPRHALHVKRRLRRPYVPAPALQRTAPRRNAHSVNPKLSRVVAGKITALLKHPHGGSGHLGTSGAVGAPRIDSSTRSDVSAFAGTPNADTFASLQVPKLYPNFEALGYACRRRAGADRAPATYYHGPYCRTVFYINIGTRRLAAVFTARGRANP